MLKTNKSIWGLREEFEAGLLAFYSISTGFLPINTMEVLGESLQCQYQLFIKTEIEIPWYERLDDF